MYPWDSTPFIGGSTICLQIWGTYFWGTAARLLTQVDPAGKSLERFRWWFGGFFNEVAAEEVCKCQSLEAKGSRGQWSRLMTLWAGLPTEIGEAIWGFMRPKVPRSHHYPTIYPSHEVARFWIWLPLDVKDSGSFFSNKNSVEDPKMKPIPLVEKPTKHKNPKKGRSLEVFANGMNQYVFCLLKKNSGFRGTMRIESNEDHKSGGWFWTWVVPRTPGRGFDSWKCWPYCCKFGDTQGPYPPNWKKSVSERSIYQSFIFGTHSFYLTAEAETVQCTWVVLETLVVSSFMSPSYGVDVCIASWSCPWLLMAEFRSFLSSQLVQDQNRHQDEHHEPQQKIHKYMHWKSHLMRCKNTQPKTSKTKIAPQEWCLGKLLPFWEIPFPGAAEE